MRRRDNRDANKNKFKKHRINEEITTREVKLVGKDDAPIVISVSAALEIAKKKNLDLVEISPNQNPPIVKIIDYRKYIFEQKKVSKEAKKKQKIIHVKEIKMRPAIDKNDFEHKINRAKKFLAKGDKVKFTLMFRGREMTHPDLGFEVMTRIQESLEGIAQTEKEPTKEGRNITMFMNAGSSNKKRKENKNED